jgi:hypothetical protein
MPPFLFRKKLVNAEHCHDVTHLKCRSELDLHSNLGKIHSSGLQNFQMLMIQNVDF